MATRSTQRRDSVPAVCQRHPAGLYEACGLPAAAAGPRPRPPGAGLPRRGWEGKGPGGGERSGAPGRPQRREGRPRRGAGPRGGGGLRGRGAAAAGAAGAGRQPEAAAAAAADGG